MVSTINNKFMLNEWKKLCYVITSEKLFLTIVLRFNLFELQIIVKKIFKLIIFCIIY